MFTQNSATKFLDTVIEKPLLYAIKSPDTELYDFGFGELIEVRNRLGNLKKKSTHTIHALCRIKVIPQNRTCDTGIYYEDTLCEIFHSDITPLIGTKVKRVALSDKNDLWLDLGDYWVVFITFENGEESWRYFISGTDTPHLIASNLWLDFSD